MSRVETETIGDDDRPVLYFHGKEQGLVLFKTNANSISAAYGDDTEDWRSGEIVLFQTMVDFQGKTMAVIRCRVLARKPEPAGGGRTQRRNPVLEWQARPAMFDLKELAETP